MFKEKQFNDLYFYISQLDTAVKVNDVKNIKNIDDDIFSDNKPILMNGE